MSIADELPASSSGHCAPDASVIEEVSLESYQHHQRSEAAGHVSEIGESMDESRIAAAAAGGGRVRGDGSWASVVRAAESIAYSMDFDDTNTVRVASHDAGSVSGGAYSQDFEEA